MNLKSKLFGFGAAAVLSLSMVSGAMANTDTTGAKVNLKPGKCAIEVTSSNAHYGNWKWDGEQNKYVAGVNGVTAQTVGLKLVNSEPNGECSLQFTFDGLFGQNDSTNHIEASNFNVTGLGVVQNFGPTNVPIPGGMLAGDGTMNLTIPNDVLPDNYSGTLEFTLDEAQ